MATNNVLGTVYETLLCSPGMNETVKIDVKITRKTVLLLNSIVDSDFGDDSAAVSELLKIVPKDEIEELKTFAQECFSKAGLKDLSEKLKAIKS